jgi:hypothetical protein
MAALRYVWPVRPGSVPASLRRERERERGRRAAIGRMESDNYRRVREAAELRRAVGAGVPDAVVTPPSDARPRSGRILLPRAVKRSSFARPSAPSTPQNRPSAARQPITTP